MPCEGSVEVEGAGTGEGEEVEEVGDDGKDEGEEKSEASKAEAVETSRVRGTTCLANVLVVPTASRDIVSRVCGG